MGEREDGFVAWEEHILCHERGSRVVHYLLKRPCGDLVLAVIGTERSIRHMMYVVSDDFVAVFGPQGTVNSSTKWRARREVVDWLSSLVSAHSDLPGSLTNNSALGSGSSAQQNLLSDQMSSRKFKVQTSGIEWTGASWVCAKLLKHYSAFWRNETTIMVHSFVFVMGLDDHRYLGYLEDMYEDKKGKKKVKVRWFHHNQEVKDLIPQLNPHPREVFITPNVQVISAECVDGPAVVLTPKHYDKCMAGVGQDSSSGIHLCFRQFKSHKLRPFTLAKLRGYANQAILSSIEMDVVPKQKAKRYNMLGGEDEGNLDNIRVGSKRIRNPKGDQGLENQNRSVKIKSSASGDQMAKSDPTCPSLKFKVGSKLIKTQAVGTESRIPIAFKVGEKIEILCQDSGIRGCWFQCKIVKMTSKLLKVQYKDVEDADGLGRLVEWVPVHKVASPDKLGMRCSGRLTIRKFPPKNLSDFSVEIGTPVDAWLSDGWWEGVVTGVGESGTESVQVYFPGEDKSLTLKRKEMRASRDWVGGKWVDIKPRPDILSCLIDRVIPGKNEELSTGSQELSGPKVLITPMSKTNIATPIDGVRIAESPISSHGPLVIAKTDNKNISGSDDADADAGNESKLGRNKDICFRDEDTSFWR